MIVERTTGHQLSINTHTPSHLNEQHTMSYRFGAADVIMLQICFSAQKRLIFQIHFVSGLGNYLLLALIDRSFTRELKCG